LLKSLKEQFNLPALQSHHVEFDADAGEYTLVAPRDIKKGSSRILLLKSLGHSFDDMKAALK
jgi:hypothetical protein